MSEAVSLIGDLKEWRARANMGCFGEMGTKTTLESVPNTVRSIGIGSGRIDQARAAQQVGLATVML